MPMDIPCPFCGRVKCNGWECSKAEPTSNLPKPEQPQPGLGSGALREALERLCDKLDKVAEDTKGIFALAHCHGSRYAGANWKEEYDAARALLSLSSLPESAARTTATLTMKQITCVKCGHRHTYDIGADPRKAGSEVREALEKLVQQLTPTVEFYLKREIESPSNHQEFAREAEKKLDKWHELTEALAPSRKGAGGK